MPPCLSALLKLAPLECPFPYPFIELTLRILEASPGPLLKLQYFLTLSGAHKIGCIYVIIPSHYFIIAPLCLPPSQPELQANQCLLCFFISSFQHNAWCIVDPPVFADQSVNEEWRQRLKHSIMIKVQIMRGSLTVGLGMWLVQIATLRAKHTLDFKDGVQKRMQNI